MPETRAQPNDPKAMLRFNGIELTLAPAMTLAQLLASQAVAPAAVSTAVNGRFVPRERREYTVLHADDEVLTFQAIVGG